MPMSSDSIKVVDHVLNVRQSRIIRGVVVNTEVGKSYQKLEIGKYYGYQSPGTNKLWLVKVIGRNKRNDQVTAQSYQCLGDLNWVDDNCAFTLACFEVPRILGLLRIGE